MKIPAFAILATIALAPAAAATAQTRTDPYAQQAIVAGDYAVAEQHLRAEYRIFPDRPEVLLNLAAVMAGTGRTSEARALYAKVLSNDDAALTLSGDREVAAHALARAGLSRLGASAFQTQVTAR